MVVHGHHGAPGKELLRYDRGGGEEGGEEEEDGEEEEEEEEGFHSITSPSSGRWEPPPLLPS